MHDATRPEWLTPELFPFESRFARVGGHLLHYIDEGPRDAPVLLMLHGNPTWSFLYRHLVPALSDRFRCVAPDLPGFGLSQAAEGYDLRPASHAAVLESFVEELGLRRYTPVVQDWGGPIGLWVAGRSPERVERLVILNTWAWPVADDPHFRRFSGLFGGALGGFFIRKANAFVNLLIPAGTPRRRLSREEMNAYRRVLPTEARREATHVFPRELLASTPWLSEVESGLGALSKKPALIVWGGADLAFRESERRRFERSFPEHETHLVEGAGHYLQEDAHEELAAALRGWWS